MQFTNKHKALLITFLISGTLVLAMFNFHIKKFEQSVAEQFYDIESEVLTEEVSEPKEQMLNSKAETNQAYNENLNTKRFAQAYKRIAPPKDYVRPDLSQSEDGFNSNTALKKSVPLDKEEVSSFNKVNTILKKQLEEDPNNSMSSMSYSLVNRKHRFLPTPIYLCEQGGKIVINITVNSSGEVIKATYNGASKSSNQCLIDHAIEYAQRARFNSNTSKASQIGTITFHFRGKN